MALSAEDTERLNELLGELKRIKGTEEGVEGCSDIEGQMYDIMLPELRRKVKYRKLKDGSRLCNELGYHEVEEVLGWALAAIQQRLGSEEYLRQIDYLTPGLAYWNRAIGQGVKTLFRQKHKAPPSLADYGSEEDEAEDARQGQIGQSHEATSIAEVTMLLGMTPGQLEKDRTEAQELLECFQERLKGQDDLLSILDQLLDAGGANQSELAEDLGLSRTRWKAKREEMRSLITPCLN